MKTYTHTQVGYVILVVSFITVLFLIWLSATLPSAEGGYVLNIVIAFVIFICLAFATLQTIVDDNYVIIKFGFGIFKKRFSLQDIASVTVVKNRWYYGWGIRVWFWPYMWIYNVSGLDAVELVMKNGKVYRIGTDVPRELEIEINNRIYQ